MFQRLLALVFAFSAAVLAAPAGARAAASHADVTLPNGLHVIAVQDRLAPVVTTVITYGAGSDDDTVPGVAHATEHMLFRGFGDLTSAQFADVATRMGGDYNAETTNEYTRYHFTAPSQYLGLILKLEAMRMTGAWIAPAEWANERGAVQQELRSHESSPAYEVDNRLRARMFGDTPLARDVGGTDAGLQKLSAADIRSFYRTWYHPNNATLVVAGDVDPADVIARVRALFGAIPRAPLPEHARIAVAPASASVIDERVNVKSPTVAFVYRYPSLKSPDYAAGLVLQAALDDPRGALAELSATGKTHGAGMAAGAYSQVGFAFVSAGATADAATDSTRALLDETLQSYLKNGIPPQLVANVQRRISAARAFELSSIQGLAFAWSDAATVGESSPLGVYQAIAKVTPADVNRVLRAYLSPQQRIVVVLRPDGTVEQAASAAPPQAENVKYTGEKQQRAPLWALAYFKDALHVRRGAPKPVTYVLPNGIKLAVLPEHTAPVVMLAGSIKMNQTLHVPEDKQGVQDVTSALQGWGGGGYDRKAFAAAAAAIPAGISPGSGFGLQVEAKNFDRALALLARVQLHPAFPADGLAVLRNYFAQALGDEQRRPDWTARMAMEAALYPPGDPVRKHATAASIGSLTLDDVKAWYARAYRPDLTTIAIVGDISPAYARDEIAKYFGDWHARGPKPDFHYPKISMNRAAAVNVPSADAKQSTVELTELLPVYRSDPQHVALDLADTILTGEGSGSQLFQDLRANTGYVYTVDSTLDIGKVRSTYQFAFASDPKNAAAATARLLADLRHLQTDLLSEDDLARAKETMLAAGVIPLASYGGIAQYALSAASGTRGPVSSLLTITPRQVRDAMAKWIRVDDFVRVTISPQNGDLRQ